MKKELKNISDTLHDFLMLIERIPHLFKRINTGNIFIFNCLMSILNNFNTNFYNLNS